MYNCNCDLSLIQIPPRSPDLNPIENFFHLVRCKLKSDALALNITKETLQEFKARIIRTIYSIPVNIPSIYWDVGQGYRLTLDHGYLYYT